MKFQIFLRVILLKEWISSFFDVYFNFLKYKLNREIDFREAGCIIQPLLPWLVACPTGVINDRSNESNKVGIVVVKCPKTKQSCTYNEILTDKSFYVERIDGKLTLKKTHSSGYFTEIQMAMGISGVDFCDFVIYTSRCLMIIRIPFDQRFFVNLVKKLNLFYRGILFPEIITRMPFTDEVWKYSLSY